MGRNMDLLGVYLWDAVAASFWGSTFSLMQQEPLGHCCRGPQLIRGLRRSLTHKMGDV